MKKIILSLSLAVMSFSAFSAPEYCVGESEDGREIEIVLEDGVYKTSNGHWLKVTQSNQGTAGEILSGYVERFVATGSGGASWRISMIGTDKGSLVMTFWSSHDRLNNINGGVKVIRYEIFCE